MSNTPNNNIPFVPENTVDPAAGLNLSLVTIDALLQLIVETVGDTEPPAEPADGDRYIVGTSATGDWSGEDNRLAVYVEDGDLWRFHDAFIALNKDDDAVYKFTSGSWTELTASGAVATLDALNDTEIVMVSDGEILMYDASAEVWVNVPMPANGAGTLDELDDVAVVGVADGEMLAYDASADVWVNVAPPAGGGAEAFTELDDTPAGYAGHGGKAVAVTDEEDGLEFIDFPATGATELNDLSDVDLTTEAPSSGDALTFDGSNWVPVTATAGEDAIARARADDALQLIWLGV